MPVEENLAERVKAQKAFYRAFARINTANFLACITVPSSPEPRLFGDCADPWQRDYFSDILPAFEHLCGRNPGYVGPMNFMAILARGHAKSSMQAWLATSAVLNSERHIHGYVLAADRDQGRLILQAQQDLLRLNDWLAQDITITKDTITGPRGEVTVLPFDAASGMGLRGNLYIADEFVHWKRQKEWTALVTGMHKVQPRLFAALSNAGVEDSWQHNAFLEAQADPARWKVFHRPGTLASWLDQNEIAQDRKLIPPSEAERLYDNKWIAAGAAYDYLRRFEVDACAAAGALAGLTVRLRKRFGVTNHVAAIDYGPRRDRTALVVLHQEGDGGVVIDRLDVWQGTPERPVKVADVDDWVRRIQRDFGPVCWVLDPYQMEGTIQWMLAAGLPVEAFKSRSGAGNYEMAQLLRALVAAEKLLWYPGAGNLRVKDKRTGEERLETLADELAGLVVKKMSYGYRFDHENQKHDDRAVAIAMAALKAVTIRPDGTVTEIPTALVTRRRPEAGSDR